MKEFRKLLASQQQTVQSFTAKVIDIDNDKKTISVLYDGLELSDVRLKSVIENSDTYILIIPSPKSFVTVSILENDINTAYVSKYNEVQEIEIKINDFKFSLNEKGFLLKNKNDTLLSLMVELIAEIAKIIVVQGTSPNVAALKAIENKFKNLLNDV